MPKRSARGHLRGTALVHWSRPRCPRACTAAPTRLHLERLWTACLADPSTTSYRYARHWPRPRRASARLQARCRAATARRQNSPSPPSARSSGRQCSHQRFGYGRAADCRVVPYVPRHRRPEEVALIIVWPIVVLASREAPSERGELHVHPPDAHTPENVRSVRVNIGGRHSVSNLSLENGILVLQTAHFFPLRGLIKSSRILGQIKKRAICTSPKGPRP